MTRDETRAGLCGVAAGAILSMFVAALLSSHQRADANEATTVRVDLSLAEMLGTFRRAMDDVLRQQAYVKGEIDALM